MHMYVKNVLEIAIGMVIGMAILGAAEGFRCCARPNCKGCAGRYPHCGICEKVGPPRLTTHTPM